MAMNNWGGVKEHMTKKPRKLFHGKRVKRVFSTSSPHSTKEEIKRDETQRKKSVQRELIIYLVIFIITILGIVFY